MTFKPVPSLPVPIPVTVGDMQSQEFSVYLRKLEAALRELQESVGELDNLPLNIAKGDVAGHSLVHKFGHNSAVGTSYVPVAIGGNYQTPTPSNAVPLRIKAGGNANDTAAGSGARAVTIIGIDATGAEISETLATAGASASAYTSANFIRLYRAYVSDSGTYASATAGSHAGDIVVEDGSNDWLTIDSTNFPKGQSEVGCYTVPAGYTAYLTNLDIEVETTKNVDALFFVRENILDETAGYPAMRARQRFSGITEQTIKMFEYPLVFAGPCDTGIMAKVSTGTAAVNVQFDMVLVANT